jgi:modulator of FtsH protease HflC
MNKILFTVPIIILVLLIIASTCLYIVPETSQVIITQFGQPKRVVSEAGLHFKTPILEQVNVFEKRILEWDGKPTQVPTLDKRYIWVDSFARWRIADPLKFFQRIRNEASAHALLDDIINSEVRNQISNQLLIDAIRSSNREMSLMVGLDGERLAEITQVKVGRNEITRNVLEKAELAANEYGMELVDIQIKRINYVEQVRRAVYERMIVERKRIAAKYRSEGEGEMMDIMGKKEKEEKQILSEAYKDSQEIKGKADAEAIKIYAEAYSKDPEFYSFLKTLESYEENLGSSSTLILSTSSDYLKYLQSPTPE